MPEMVASCSSQRFSALLAFQRDIDSTCPTHMGKTSNAGRDEFSFLERKAPGYNQVHHGDPWQQNWSDTFSQFLPQSLRGRSESLSPSRAEETTASASCGTLTLSRGRFSPKSFIRNALKRAFATDDFAPKVKKAKFEEQYSTAVPMECC